MTAVLFGVCFGGAGHAGILQEAFDAADPEALDTASSRSMRPIRPRATRAALKISIPVEYEALTPGPVGERLEVVDCRRQREGLLRLRQPGGSGHPERRAGWSRRRRTLASISRWSMRSLARTLSNFDRALGRRLRLSKGPRVDKLRLFPHGFRGRNAFYDRDLHAILFGYFDADETAPGSNIPRQRIFTCLSHDIIAHEMTHAIVDRLRRFFLEPTNVDTQAFHEGFSDIVALFQHFSFPDLLEREIERSRGTCRARRCWSSLPGSSVSRPERKILAVGARQAGCEAAQQRHRAPRSGCDPGRGRVRRLLSDLPIADRRPGPHRDRRQRPPAPRPPAAASGPSHRRRSRPHRAAASGDVHPGLRLPAARRRHLRRFPAGAGDGRLRAQPRRRVWGSARR